MNVVLLGSNTKEEIENNLRIVASAGALSRSEGTVMDVYESKNDYQKNLRLAKAVVGYGHRSISEHDYLVFALENVTPVIEQTLIEDWLTSFTIKSRRNVDFRNVGFYVPDFKTVKGDRLDSRELKLDLENAKSKIREKNTSAHKKIQRNWLEDRLDKETLSKLENIRRNRWKH